MARKIIADRPACPRWAGQIAEAAAYIFYMALPPPPCVYPAGGRTVCVVGDMGASESKGIYNVGEEMPPRHVGDV